MGNQASLNSQEVAEAASVASDSDNESDSRNKKTKTIKRAKGEDDFVVNLMMPTYYRADPLTQKDIDFAKKSWESIVNNTSTVYHELKKDPNFKFENCEVWFYSNFYNRLFDVHPLSRHMFRDPGAQGKFLVSLFSFIFTALSDKEKFDLTLHRLAESHCKKGVKAVEYGIIGDVMFWTVKKCIGNEAYSGDTHSAWVKIFSKMLSVIVPVSVAYELESGEAQTKRLKGLNSHFIAGSGKSERVPNEILSSSK